MAFITEKKNVTIFLWGIVYNEISVIFVSTKRINKMNKSNFYLLGFVVSCMGFSIHLIRLFVTLDPIHFLCVVLWGIISTCLLYIVSVENKLLEKE